MIVRSVGDSTSIVSAPQKQGNDSFKDLLAKAFEKVNSYQIEYDDVLRKIAAGEEINVHEIMIAAEKARLSLELAIQVRNKAIEAYQEIMRMQI
ncbi:MAG: flagellar hook-basal body complex protein FliE [Thermosediminibacteraceae bacterium]|nr:flagellar hook-basal body complex protein FliE [Thermosediminibacteraceae bacterium]